MGPPPWSTTDRDDWVSEGQLGHLLGQIPGPPTTPFLLRRIPAN